MISKFLEFITEKITKKATKDYLKFMLSKNEKWAIKTLIKIYNLQTDEEKNLHQTV